jgi:hypothetical protein
MSNQQTIEPPAKLVKAARDVMLSTTKLAESAVAASSGIF